MKQTNNLYGFIYITTNLINNKKYIGQRKYDDKSKWNSYLGSGVALKNAIKKHGRENFIREIIDECYSKEELDEKERYWIQYYDAVNSTQFYNIASGGEGYDFFSSDQWDTSRIVYCIEERIAFKNACIASQIIDENESTIRTKCKNYKNKLRNIKKGYHWCYIEDMYSTFENKVSSSANPVVLLSSGRVYGSWSNVNKCLHINLNRRNIISIERYYKLINQDKSLNNKLMYLTDYLKLYDFTK